MAEDDEDPDLVVIEAPHPDGGTATLRTRLVDGPHPCPFCGGSWSVLEPLSGGGSLIMHPAPYCQAYAEATAEAFLALVQEEATGLTSRQRGSA